MTAFNLLDFDAAIYTRLVTDLAVGAGTYARGVYWMQAPTDTRPTAGLKPYVIYMPLDLPALDDFRSNSIQPLYEVWIIDHADNGSLAIAAAWDRIYGDWEADTQTYGLHRRQLSIGGDNTASVLEYVTGSALYIDDPKAIGLRMQFRFIYQKG